MVYEKALNIYTDGSCLPAPRRGGIGILFVTIDAEGREVVEPVDAQGYAGATNNEMELLACTTALHHAADHPHIQEFERVVIFTDSLYVKENAPRAFYQWPLHERTNRDGCPINIGAHANGFNGIICDQETAAYAANLIKLDSIRDNSCLNLPIAARRSR